MPSLRGVASIGFVLTMTTALLLSTVPCSAQTFRGGNALDVVSYHDSTSGVTAYVNLPGRRSAFSFCLSEV